MGLPDLYPAQVGSPYTTLAAPYTAGGATMTVVDATKLPDAPNIVCLAGAVSGEFRYTGKDGNILQGVAALPGTPAATTWSAGTFAFRGVSAYDHNALIEYAQMDRPKRGAYDAIVYISGTSVIAEDATGATITSGTAGTDDATVITAANATLTAGGILYLAPGTYDLGIGTMAFGDSVQVVGAGLATILDASGLDYWGIRPGINTRMANLKITGVSDHGGIKSKDGCTYEDLWVDGTCGLDTILTSNITVSRYTATNVHDSSGQAACLHASQTTGLRAENLHFTDSDRGVEIENGSTNVQIRNVYLSGIRVDGSYAIVLDVHNHVGGAACKDVIFENIRVDDCYVAYNVWAEGDVHENIVIRNLHATQCTRRPAFGCIRGRLQDCTIDLDGVTDDDGVKIGNICQDVVVDGCKILNACTYDGINVSGENCTILNSSVHVGVSPANYAIRVLGSRNAVIGCRFEGTPEFYMLSSAAKNNQISKNQWSAAKGVVLTAASATCIVSENVMGVVTIDDSGAGNVTANNVLYTA